MAASEDRWITAQKYEKGFWEGVARRAAEDSTGQIDFYEWRASELMKRASRLGFDALFAGNARILELGSGPVGILGFLPGERKVAVDPLNPFYDKNEHLARFRNPDVEYLAASGEEVPLESQTFDLCIIENCIDHVRDVRGVMTEIHRLLRPDGILYITVNARSRLGYYVHRLLARLALDPGHPHTFTKARFLDLLATHGFETLDLEASSWWQAWRNDLVARSWKAKAKGILCVSEHLLIGVARKLPPDAVT